MFKNTGDERNINIISDDYAQRSIYIDGYIDNEVANSVTAQLIFLSITNPEKAIYLLINSSGGNFYDGMAIYDVIQNIPSDVITIGIGEISGIATLLLASGSEGKRICVNDSKIHVNQTMNFGQDQLAIERVEIEFKEILHINKKFNNLLSKHSNQSSTRINSDAEGNLSMFADEAKNYGIVDRVINSDSNIVKIIQSINKASY
jgi:ATP-dependent Clp protease, protease subunit